MVWVSMVAVVTGLDLVLDLKACVGASAGAGVNADVGVGIGIGLGVVTTLT
jgi:hypothetical protein